MNWADLKKHLEEKGVKDEMPIGFIDINWPDAANPPQVNISRSGWIEVTDGGF